MFFAAKNSFPFSFPLNRMIRRITEDTKNQRSKKRRETYVHGAFVVLADLLFRIFKFVIFDSHDIALFESQFLEFRDSSFFFNIAIQIAK